MATTTTETLIGASVKMVNIVTNTGEFSDLIDCVGASSVVVASNTASVRLKIPFFTIATNTWRTDGAFSAFLLSTGITDPTATTVGTIPGNRMPPKLQIAGAGTGASVQVYVYYENGNARLS